MGNIVLGKLCKDGAVKDAVHQAIAPVVAATELRPGTHVGADGSERNPIGIVDPFLKKAVQQGETFWLWMYPNSIQQLRHEWTHPAFVAKASSVPKSTAWLKSYAAKHLAMQDDWRAEDECTSMGCDETPTSYDAFMSNAYSKEVLYYGHDLKSINDLEDREELREHLQVMLGEDIDFNWTGWKFGRKDQEYGDVIYAN